MSVATPARTPRSLQARLLLTVLALWVSPVIFMQLLVVMALAGGLLTVLMVMWHTMRRQKDKLAIPYGVAIAFGGLWVLAANYLPGAATAAQAA